MPSFTSIVSILAVAASAVMAREYPSYEAPSKSVAAECAPASKSVEPAYNAPHATAAPKETYVADPAVKAPHATAAPKETYVADPAVNAPHATAAPKETYVADPAVKNPISFTTSTTTSAVIADPTASVQGNCNVNSAVSCCNTDGQTTGNNLLGGSCFLNLPALGTTCETGSAFCCETNQVGLINTNLACSPVGLL
ncbi:hypothetical protein AC579_6878 [Pseudocercospora musae]|uniref:Hydrophobin n=1 Tax=Pseudocercospora musae TaxID=113226 RepID=A0A139HL29_9PEZI|nr:hypothetical protein AC579_6878 [Pseudocercospora musae]